MPQLMTSPIPLPIPQDAPLAAAGATVTQQPAGVPLIWKFVLGSYSKVTFDVSSSSAINLGIYGPMVAGMTVLGIGQDGKSNGRMRAPKAGDAASGQGKGNFTAGTYYLVVRTGDNGPPAAAVSVAIKTSFPWPW